MTTDLELTYEDDFTSDDQVPLGSSAEVQPEARPVPASLGDAPDWPETTTDPNYWD